MTFEAVLPALKEGKKAVRTGWEGTELYVQLVPEGKFEGDTLNPYFLIKTADEASACGPRPTVTFWPKIGSSWTYEPV